MAIDEADSELDESSSDAAEAEDTPVVTGTYSWLDFYAEYGDDGDFEALREALQTDGNRSVPTRELFDRTDLDPSEHLGFEPTQIEDALEAVSKNAGYLDKYVDALEDGEVPVTKGWYSWEAYKREYFYDDDGNPPSAWRGEPEEFDAAEELGFEPAATESLLGAAADAAEQLDEIVDERTVDTNEDVDEDAFFSTSDGTPTVANRYDLEKEVPLAKKKHFREEERYWVNKPYSFVIIFHSVKENEKKYYVIQPYLNEIEHDLQEFLTGKLRSSIKYSEQGAAAENESNRKRVIEDEMYSLLERYDLYSRSEGDGMLDGVAQRFGAQGGSGMSARVLGALGWEGRSRDGGRLEGIAARPESVVLAEDSETLNDYQVEKLLYYLKRDFIGYERIDGIKHDINVEDISCDGYNSPVFVYHSDYEQIISNVYHGKDELDDFVVKLAQRSGKGISKRSPQVDATLSDGSRAQLTLGEEVSDHGTNYTIRQFKDVPFTPIDLINWKTFSLEEMAFLWLCIENHKSLIFAGGTASGKTTSLNAVSLFIPSNSKIVSIEDTREVELPQRNWIASVTRPSFSDDDKGDVDEFDLLEAALRQRPDYIVMGEIRGEEGRTLFQVMSTGHTTYTTFHADSVGEVLKRFTTDPINVSKTMFTALDLVSIQTSTRVNGHKVRRNKNLTEINHYDAENDEINVQDIYQWQAESDDFLQMGAANTLEEIKFDRGWSQQKLSDEIFERKTVLAYLIDRGLNTYTQVAATFQAYINDPETILTLMANESLRESLEDLREMESVLIDIDPDKEEMVPRPDPDEERLEEANRILDEAEDRVLEEYRGEPPADVASALVADAQPEVTVETGDRDNLEEIADDADPAASGPEGETQASTDGEPAPDVPADGSNATDDSTAADAGGSSDATDGSSNASESVGDAFGIASGDRDAVDGDGDAAGGDGYAAGGDLDDAMPDDPFGTAQPPEDDEGPADGGIANGGSEMGTNPFANAFEDGNDEPTIPDEPVTIGSPDADEADDSDAGSGLDRSPPDGDPDADPFEEPDVTTDDSPASGGDGDASDDSFGEFTPATEAESEVDGDENPDGGDEPDGGEVDAGDVDGGEADAGDADGGEADADGGDADAGDAGETENSDAKGADDWAFDEVEDEADEE